MPDWLKNILAHLFRPSIDKVISQFTRASEKLRELATHHDNESARKSKLAEALIDEAQTHDDEFDRAHLIANKLDSLVK